MKYLLLGLCCVFLGCNLNESRSSHGNIPTNPPNNTASAQQELQGNWQQACVADSSGSGSSRTFLSSQDSSLQLQQQEFLQAPNCSGTPDLESRVSFNYSVPNFSEGQTNSLDMTLRQLVLRFSSASAVATANATSFCGFNDWQLGVEKDVTAKGCVPNLPAAAGQPFFQIYRIVSTELFVGEIDASHSGLAPEQRPSTLQSTPFTR